MNNNNQIILVFSLLILAISLFTCGVPAFADNNIGQLPGAESFRPDDSAFDAALVIIKVVAWFAGIAGAVIFAVSLVILVVKDVKEIIKGDSSLKDKKSRFMAIGVCYCILLLIITGKWYDVISTVWNKIMIPFIDVFNN